MMESLALHTAHIKLPCVHSHTLVRTYFGAWRREDILIAGECCGHTCCAVLYFDTAAIRDITPKAAELCFTLQSVLLPGRGITLCIAGPGGASRLIHACAPGPLCADVLGLITGLSGNLLRIAVRPEWPCGLQALIEPNTPAPCIVVTPDIQRGCGIRTEQQDFDVEFDPSASTPVVDTALARQCTFYVTNVGDAPFTAELETCAQMPQWVCDVRLTISAGETRALVAKFYGSLARIRFSSEGAGRAQVSFIGQYFT